MLVSDPNGGPGDTFSLSNADGGGMDAPAISTRAVLPVFFNAMNELPAAEVKA